MSMHRCGLSVSRNSNITQDYHNSPRWKQIGCLTNGASLERNQSESQDEVLTDEISQALEDENLRKTAENIKSMQDEAKELTGAGLRTRLSQALAYVSNKFPDSDINARPVDPGEHHQILKLKSGKYGRANYSGPGTNIIKRTKRNDPPRTPVDEVAQAHDLRYSLSTNTDDVRVADRKMLSSLDRLQNTRGDSKINIYPAKAGIRTKVLAEDFNLLSKSKFIDPERPSLSDQKILQAKLDQLEMKGLGIPGQKLLKKYQRKVKNKKKSKSKKPLYTEELEISNMLANKLLPMLNQKFITV